MKHRLHCNSWLIPTGLSILSRGKIIFLCAQERLPIGSLAKLCKKQPSELQVGAPSPFMIQLKCSSPGLQFLVPGGRAGGRRGGKGRRNLKSKVLATCSNVIHRSETKRHFFFLLGSLGQVI